MASSSINRSAEPAACDSSPQTSLNCPSPLAANTANSTNWLSRPGVISPAITSCAPTQRMTTTLAEARKMMIAVRIARACVDWIAAPIGALDRFAKNARRASGSLVKACKVRTAPISSAA